MRKSYVIIIGVIVIILRASPICLAIAESPEEIEALLHHARKITAKASLFSVASYSIGNLQKTIRVYRKSASDGTLLERIENIWSDSLTETCISNQSGTYIIRGESILRVNYLPGSRSFTYSNSPDYRGIQLKYSITESSYQGIPCFKVTIGVPDNAVTQAILENRFAKSIQKYPDYLSTRFPVEKEYLIDKEKKFIYSCSFYNATQKRIFACDWGKVDFQEAIDESLFIPPSGTVVPIGDDEKEALRYLRSLFFINLVRKAPDKEKVEPQDKARQILFSAMRKSRKTPFRATLKVNQGGRYRKTVQVHYWPRSDGKVWEKVEHTWSNNWKETYIHNGEGYFTIFDRTVVKTEFPAGSRRFIFESVKQDVVEDAAYSMSAGSYNGKPCYLITVKIPTDPEYVAKRITRIQRHSSKSREELLKQLPFVKTYLVDKEKNFIYSCTLYSLVGRRIAQVEWGQVVFSPTMSDDIFDITEDKPLVIKNARQFLQERERCIEDFKQKRRYRFK